MSVRERMIDARALMTQGRWEGALCLVLIAVAATSRKRFPKGTLSKRNPSTKMGDREAFETFVDADLPGKTAITLRGAQGWIAVDFRGEPHLLVHILYKFLRCELVHEGAIPSDILFEGDPQDQRITLRAADESGHQPLYLSRSWFTPLMRLVCEAPENANEFADPPP